MKVKVHTLMSCRSLSLSLSLSLFRVHVGYACNLGRWGTTEPLKIWQVLSRQKHNIRKLCFCWQKKQWFSTSNTYHWLRIYIYIYIYIYISSIKIIRHILRLTWTYFPVSLKRLATYLPRVFLKYARLSVRLTSVGLWPTWVRWSPLWTSLWSIARRSFGESNMFFFSKQRNQHFSSRRFDGKNGGINWFNQKRPWKNQLFDGFNDDFFGGFQWFNHI